MLTVKSAAAAAQQSGVAAYVPGVSSWFSPAGRPAYRQPRNGSAVARAVTRSWHAPLPIWLAFCSASL